MLNLHVSFRVDFIFFEYIFRVVGILVFEERVVGTFLMTNEWL